MKRDGLTLLETMVALVILGVVALGFLEVFQGSVRLAADSKAWSQAVAYATDGMEGVKLDPQGVDGGSREVLAGGFARQVDSRAWRDGVRLVTVVVFLPRGGRVALNRLLETR